jgi:hypothetical protein
MKRDLETSNPSSKSNSDAVRSYCRARPYLNACYQRVKVGGRVVTTPAAVTAQEVQIAQPGYPSTTRRQQAWQGQPMLLLRVP